MGEYMGFVVICQIMFQSAKSKIVSYIKSPSTPRQRTPDPIFTFDIDDDPGSVSGSVSLGGFPPVEERSRPDGAEEEAPDTNRTSGDDGDDEEDDEADEEYDSVPDRFERLTSSQVLPWGAPKERARFPSNVNIETDIRPGEFVMRT